MFDPKIIHKRIRKAVLRIYDNSGLRDQLDDDQAKPLLAWAAAHAEKGAKRTKHMGDEDADAMVEHHVDTAEHVVRLVNGLTQSLPEITNELEMEAVLQRLRESLLKLGGDDTAITNGLNSIMGRLGQMDISQSYSALMNVVNAVPAVPPPATAENKPEQTESAESDDFNPVHHPLKDKTADAPVASAQPAETDDFNPIHRPLKKKETEEIVTSTQPVEADDFNPIHQPLKDKATDEMVASTEVVVADDFNPTHHPLENDTAEETETS